MRIGTGFDAHRFGTAPVATVRIGGVDVPHPVEILAHSDGDVVLHALCDALLGALALGDIGQHFPDTDDAFADVDSLQLLRHCYQLVTDRGYRLVNCDMTLIAQRPRVAAYIVSMREIIASTLAVETDQVSVKATTTERMGYIGREEGLAAEAVVLLSRGAAE
ncbi:MAG: 2-C-methyl-D-erythritol 2,4-cyclodiphosphate synthase [Pseudomonadales bacterium]|nr:2-C-methyl-D-erythritol 2,4-cyclodiphosphate synthase [Pseudomonadales bacterium]